MPDVLYPEIVDFVLERLRATFGSNFNEYYEGDPQNIPKANLPCVIVETLTDQLTLDGAPTGFDMDNGVLQIRLVMNKADDLKALKGTDLTERKLRLLVKAINPETGTYKEGTVAHMLRSDPSFAGLLRNSDVDISYDLNPRPGLLVTSEAIIQISTREKIRRY